MAVMWITHDLGIVAGLCDRVIVMYAGRVVEQAPARELYARPAHPYTLGLMGSLPRLDGKSKARLQAIPGLPPDLVHVSPGCAFAPRCRFAYDRCNQERPDLRTVGDGHFAACWLDPEVTARLRQELLPGRANRNGQRTPGQGG